LASAGVARILWELIHAVGAFHSNPPQQVSTMSRHLASLALSSTLSLMSSVALAQSADAVCSFADKEMLAALRIENFKPTVEHKEVAHPGSATTMIMLCKLTSSQDGVIQLIMGSSPAPAGVAIPPNCITQPVPGIGMQLIACTATAQGELVNAQLFTKNDEEGKRLTTVFRAHFERRIKELNK
jgi:hypothetical protein